LHQSEEFPNKQFPLELWFNHPIDIAMPKHLILVLSGNHMAYTQCALCIRFLLFFVIVILVAALALLFAVENEAVS